MDIKTRMGDDSFEFKITKMNKKDGKYRLVYEDNHNDCAECTPDVHIEGKDMIIHIQSYMCKLLMKNPVEYWIYLFVAAAYKAIGREIESYVSWCRNNSYLDYNIKCLTFQKNVV